jgi:hypothetical protein
MALSVFAQSTLLSSSQSELLLSVGKYHCRHGIFGRKRAMSAARKDRRRGAFTKLLKDANATMVIERQATKFLDGFETFDSKAELLSKLDDNRDEGPRRIREVLSFINSVESVDYLLIRLLKHVITKETSRPLFARLRNKVLVNVYMVPALLETLVEYDVAILMTADSANYLCLFLVAISKTLMEARRNESVMELAKSLRDRGDVNDARTLCALVLVETHREVDESKVRTPGRTTVMWVTDEILPGGRHDNDHENFRNIRVIPTADELCCEARPWLPLASGENDFVADPPTRLISNNFRLLREDALITMKKRIVENYRPWANARIVDLDISVSKGFSFVVQCDTRGKGSCNWEVSRSLAGGAVVAFCKEGAPEVMGTISVRDARTKGEWLNAPGGPMIGVMFDIHGGHFKRALDFLVNNSSLAHHMKVLRGQYEDASKKKQKARIESSITKMERYKRHMVSFDMIEASSSFFAYEPILKSLQLMTSIPFVEEMCEKSSGSTGNLDYLPPQVRLPKNSICNGHLCDFLSWSADDVLANTTLDISQVDALYHTFTNRVALIQGPPGTGKRQTSMLVWWSETFVAQF